MDETSRRLAVVTGASTGIGYELAKQCARHGFDLLIAADEAAFALRAELKDTGVTVTCLMPGPTETEFFERAGMTDTQIGQSKKADPAGVAKSGFEATMRGQGDVVSGWTNKLQAAIANIT